MTTLSNAEKIAVINQHIKNIEYSKYNLEISIIEENAATAPSQETIDSLNDQIADLENKKAALNSEIATLS